MAPSQILPKNSVILTEGITSRKNSLPAQHFLDLITQSTGERLQIPALQDVR